MTPSASRNYGCLYKGKAGASPRFRDSAPTTPPVASCDVPALKSSVSAATFGNGLHWLCYGLDFGDLDADLVRRPDKVLPRKGTRPLGRKLVKQRDRIMVIQEDEMGTHGQVEPGANNQAVLDRAGDGADVHDVVRANEVISSSRCIHVLLFFCSVVKVYEIPTPVAARPNSVIIDGCQGGSQTT